MVCHVSGWHGCYEQEKGEDGTLWQAAETVPTFQSSGCSNGGEWPSGPVLLFHLKIRCCHCAVSDAVVFVVVVAASPPHVFDIWKLEVL